MRLKIANGDLSCGPRPRDRNYNRKFMQTWKQEGCFDEVGRSMGYRLALKSAEASDSARPSAADSVSGLKRRRRP